MSKPFSFKNDRRARFIQNKDGTFTTSVKISEVVFPLTHDIYNVVLFAMSFRVPKDNVESKDADLIKIVKKSYDFILSTPKFYNDLQIKTTAIDQYIVDKYPNL